MIPKIIHYCWFGGNPLPKLAQKCIASWKQYFPDYEIWEWNEKNYDVRKTTYISEAYGAKKYAFVSDYARFDILYQYGGIYFDTDVEVIKPFDAILERGGFTGCEAVGRIAPGVGIGSAIGLKIFQEILDVYATVPFLNTDGSCNLASIVEYVTPVFKKYNFKAENTIQEFDGIVVYPHEYFCPKMTSGAFKITENTYSIHYFMSSWVKKPTLVYERIRDFSIRIFGYTFGKIIVIPLFIVTKYMTHGIDGIKKALKKKLTTRNAE